MKKHILVAALLVAGSQWSCQKKEDNTSASTTFPTTTNTPTSSNFNELLTRAYTKDYIGEPKIYYGASYYPETWDTTEIERDIAYMKELNMNVVRMAEFSWAKMEPQEGKYDFTWLHKIIDKLHANGISVILGTPTATPPIWLIEKYPDIMATEPDGQVKEHGVRRDYNPSSANYRKASYRICEKMAQEFGKKPGVIGWQTDNEFSLEMDYSEQTRKEWIKWLEKEYKTIENLNQIWATDLWSQTYQRFDQIPMPKMDIWFHPSLKFAWKRFCSHQIVTFQDEQIIAIRKHSDLPITHDATPSNELNMADLFKHLDFMATNNYHSFEAYDKIVSNYDRMRGYHKGRHWLFETAPNHSGGGVRGQIWYLHQPKGSLHAALWLNYALGGQGAMYWLWRQHRAGQEMVHGAVLHAWGKPFANFEDLKKLGADLKKTSDFQMNAPVAPAQIAILYDHEANMGFSIEEHANGIRYYTDFTYRFYLPLQQSHLHRDVINVYDDLTRYKVLFMPILPVVRPALRNKIKEWVNNGGTLIIGPMTGYRNEEWAANTKFSMGDFEEWFGINVETRLPIGTSIRPAESPTILQFNKPLNLPETQCFLWSEALSSATGEVLATYKNSDHEGKPAIIKNKVGKGNVVLLGTDPGKEALAQLLLQEAAAQGIQPIATGDKGMVVVPRKGEKEKGFIVVSYENRTQKITINGIKGAKDLLTGKTIESDNLTLAPYQVLVIQQ